MRPIVIAAFTLLSLIAEAQSQLRADRAKSTITYYMRHALHAWTGVSREVNCIMETDGGGAVTKVAATAKVKSFDSKNSNRDAHMLEVTDALTHPNISFYSKSVSQKEGVYKVSGMLSFHGVEKPMDIEVREVKEGARRRFRSTFVFLLEDFKIVRPTLFMVKTDNEVKVELDFLF
jgi:polyisoprenoid-binding protein YceI